MVMCYKIKKKGASYSWAYRKLKLRVLTIAKSENIAKIGQGSLPYVLCFFV